MVHSQVVVDHSPCPCRGEGEEAHSRAVADHTLEAVVHGQGVAHTQAAEVRILVAAVRTLEAVVRNLLAAVVHNQAGGVHGLVEVDHIQPAVVVHTQQVVAHHTHLAEDGHEGPDLSAAEHVGPVRDAHVAASRTPCCPGGAALAIGHGGNDFDCGRPPLEEEEGALRHGGAPGRGPRFASAHR